MKKRIAIVLTLILATGTCTACTAEKVNEDNKTSVVSTADVSSSTESSEPLPTEIVTEITTIEKATVSQNTEPAETDTQTEEKADSGENLGNQTQIVQSVEVEPNTQSNAENSENKVPEKLEDKTENKPEQKPVQNVTEPLTQKPTVKPTQPPTEAKTIDIQYVVSSCISYCKQLGMNYDSSLNTSNASWFSPTNTEYYSDTQSLLNDCYNDVEYTAYFHQDSGIEPSDLTFNVIAEQNKIYIVYC